MSLQVPESGDLSGFSIAHERLMMSVQLPWTTGKIPSASAESEERLRSIRIDGRRRHAIRRRCPIVDDVRYAMWQFARALGFTGTAVLTLALGTCATTAIFTLVHAVLLKSLPVARPSKLYRVGDIENCCVNGGLQDDWSLFSYDKYKTYRDQTPGFTELAAFGRTEFDGRSAQRAQPNRRVPAEPVRFGKLLFDVWDSRICRGMFTQEDDRTGAEPVVVMSYASWQQKYGQDPSVIGASFTLNGLPFTVIGVAPPKFYGDRMESMPAFWVPLNAEALIDGPGNFLQFPQQDWLDLIGRIAPGADPKRIEAQLQVELK